MDLSVQKRLAAEILGVGVNNIKFDEERIDLVQEAFTREDIRALIKDGVIYYEKPHRNSRGRINRVKRQKKKGRRRGHGSRKGSKDARVDSRRMWINRIRKIRRYLKYLKDNDIIDTRTYRMLYRRAKGGAFRTFESLKHYMETEGILKRKE